MLFGKHKENEKLTEIEQLVKQSAEKAESVLNRLQSVPEQVSSLQSQVEILQAKLEEQINYCVVNQPRLKIFWTNFRNKKKGRRMQKTGKMHGLPLSAPAEDS